LEQTNNCYVTTHRQCGWHWPATCAYQLTSLGSNAGSSLMRPGSLQQRTGQECRVPPTQKAATQDTLNKGHVIDVVAGGQALGANQRGGPFVTIFSSSPQHPSIKVFKVLSLQQGQLSLLGSPLFASLMHISVCQTHGCVWERSKCRLRHASKLHAQQGGTVRKVWVGHSTDMNSACLLVLIVNPAQSKHRLQASKA
jgi:hypothetical protein